MKIEQNVEVAIVGAGIAGIATAYYLCTRFGKKSISIIDHRQPMSFTSAQTGDNYRDWWPHPTMVAFTDRSIDLMEQIARETSNVFGMSRRGYLLATRLQNIDELISDLYTGYGDRAQELVRVRDTSSISTYSKSLSASWESAPDGVDVLTDAATIKDLFPAIADDICNVIHVRRGGEINSQQLAVLMLQRIREFGGRLIAGRLHGVTVGNGFKLELETATGIDSITAGCFVNAAGPFAKRVAAMIDIELPVKNLFQQKIAFVDSIGAVPRDLPFTVDIDEARLEWSDEDRELLTNDPEFIWLTQTLPGGTHCRPDGNEHGKWVKLGWAYNIDPSEPQEQLANEPKLDERFPEIVIRGASSLIPSLAEYIDRPPTRFSHYGGYYTMTEENWPLIGPMGVDGAFTVSGLSGFGSMAACAAGLDCATWMCGGELPHYAADLSLERYADARRLADLRQGGKTGLL